jgi:NADPH-dependent curcumin reductase CurA
MAANLARGEINYWEDVTHGLEKAGEALLVGKNNGKSVINVAQE